MEPMKEALGPEVFAVGGGTEALAKVVQVHSEIHPQFI